MGRVAVAVLVVLTCMVPADAANLVLNPSFESGSLPPWVAYTRSGTASASVVSDTHYLGRYALEVNATSGRGGAYQVFDTPVGRNIRIVVWYKGPDASFGIDPYGGTNPESAQWDEGHNSGGVWASIVKDVTAEAPQMTVFLDSNAAVTRFNNIVGTAYGSIDGTVRNSFTNEPVPDAEVKLSNGQNAWTDANGYYIFDSVGPGTYNATCLHWLYYDLDLTGIVVNEGTTTTTNVHIVPYGAIEGYARDVSTGNGIEGVDVSLNTGQKVKSGPDGYYHFLVLTEGAYDIQFRHWRYQDLDVLGVAVADGTTTIQHGMMTTRPTGNISGTVTAVGSGPLGDARVWLSEIPMEAYADSNGNYSITGVPVGSFTLNARKSGYVPQERPVTMTTGGNLDEDFQLAWRVIPPGNRVVNGDFESGTLDSWNEWCATHFTEHQYPLDSVCNYGDQWVRGGGAIRIAYAATAGQGYAGSTGLKLGSFVPEGANMYSGGGHGGICQMCYVEPGKYYRARAMFKAQIAPDLYYSVGLGLVDGRFDPGVYSSPFESAPTNADDVFLIATGRENAFEMSQRIAEPNRWWHNIVALRSTPYNGDGGWDWQSTLDNLPPRNYLCGATRRATDDIMTVVVAMEISGWTWTEGQQYALFDNIVLEEVPAPGGPMSLGDLAKVDFRPPYSEYPEIAPQIPVDLSAAANAKVVTGVFDNETYGSFFYIEELDLPAGIRVESANVSGIQVGDKVSLKGYLTSSTGFDIVGAPTIVGERVIVADESSVQVVGTSPDLPAVLAMSLRNTSARFPYLDPLAELYGVGNAGLLCRVSGKVVESYDDGFSIWLQIDDGSGREFWLKGAPSRPTNGANVSATGILGLEMSPASWQPAKVLRIRAESAADDFRVY